MRGVLLKPKNTRGRVTLELQSKDLLGLSPTLVIQPPTTSILSPQRPHVQCHSVPVIAYEPIVTLFSIVTALPAPLRSFACRSRTLLLAAVIVRAQERLGGGVERRLGRRSTAVFLQTARVNVTQWGYGVRHPFKNPSLSFSSTAARLATQFSSRFFKKSTRWALFRNFHEDSHIHE
eukprot:7113204-Pyramimonas_sp.AAC.1